MAERALDTAAPIGRPRGRGERRPQITGTALPTPSPTPTERRPRFRTSARIIDGESGLDKNIFAGRRSRRSSTIAKIDITVCCIRHFRRRRGGRRSFNCVRSEQATRTIGGHFYVFRPIIHQTRLVGPLATAISTSKKSLAYLFASFFARL